MANLDSGQDKSTPRNTHLRELNLDQLDQVVGGANAPAPTPSPHQFDQAAGFDTSHLNLSAAAMASGQAEAGVAQAIQNHQATVAQGMHLLEAVANFEHSSPTQALASFAGQVTGLAGHAGDAVTIGGEIAHLVGTHQVTLPQAITDINTAVTGHTLDPHVAVSMLFGMAASGDVHVSHAAGAEVATMISNQQITQADAISGIDTAVHSHTLTADQAIGMLVGLAAGGSSSTVAAVVHEVNSLINAHQITPTQAIGDIARDASLNADGANQTVGMLASVAAQCAPAAQFFAGEQIAMLFESHQLSASQAMSDIGSAVASHAISADAAVAMLTGVAAVADAAGQNAANVEIGTLVSNGQISATQAVADVTQAIAANGPDAIVAAMVGLMAVPALQNAAGAEIGTLINANQITPQRVMADIAGDAAANGLTADQTVGLLAGIAAQCGSTAQLIAGEQITTMIEAGKIAASQAVSDIGSAVASHAISADAAVTMLAGMAIQATASNDPATHNAADAGIGTLVSTGQISATRAIADLVGAAHSNDAVVTEMAGLIALGVPGLQNTASAEIASLISSHAMTADHAITLLAGAAAGGDTHVMHAAGAEVAALISGGLISQAAAISDIDSAVKAHTLSTDQAVGMLVGLAAGGSTTLVTAVAHELFSVFNAQAPQGWGVTDVQHFMSGIAGHAAANLTGDQAVILLAEIGVAFSPGTAGIAIATLIENNQIAASQAINDVAGLVRSHAINMEYGDAELAAIAGAPGGAAFQNLALGALAGFANDGLKPPLHIVWDMFDAGQNVGNLNALFAGFAAALNPATQAAWAAALPGQVITGQIGADNILSIALGMSVSNPTLAPVLHSVTTGVVHSMSADAAVSQMMVAAAQGAGTVSTSAMRQAAAGEIATLIHAGTITPDKAVSDMIYRGLNAQTDPTDNSHGLDVIGAADGVIAGLIHSGAVPASTVVNQLIATCDNGRHTGAQTVQIMLGISEQAQDTSSMRAMGGGLATLIAHNDIKSADAFAAINNQLTTQVPSLTVNGAQQVAMTPASAAGVLMGMAEAGPAALQTQVGSEFLTLQANGQLTGLTSVLNDIQAAQTHAGAAWQTMTNDQRGAAVVAQLLADDAKHTLLGS